MFESRRRNPFRFTWHVPHFSRYGAPPTSIHTGPLVRLLFVCYEFLEHQAYVLCVKYGAIGMFYALSRVGLEYLVLTQYLLLPIAFYAYVLLCVKCSCIGIIGYG